MEKMKAKGRTLPKALKARYSSEDTDIKGYLSRCYHLDRQIDVCIGKVQFNQNIQNLSKELKYMNT